MRYTTAGLLLALAATPAAGAQQISMADPALPPTAELPRFPEPVPEVSTSEQAPRQVRVSEVKHIEVANESAEPISARSVLAIIGAVVVVAALIVLFA